METPHALFTLQTIQKNKHPQFSTPNRKQPLEKTTAKPNTQATISLIT
jgi:hypothetical protein